jgi:dephospho-CoA kinase
MKKIICLIGSSGAGKGTSARILEKYGYTTLSLSQEVRKAVAELGLVNASREQLQLMANSIRQERGYDYFARKVIASDSFQTHDYIVLDGVRNIAELNLIRGISSEIGASVLILGITANLENRFNRIILRRDLSDPLTFEEFVRNDEREKGNSVDLYGQQLSACLQQVDFLLENNGEVEELEARLYRLISEKGLFPEGNINSRIERM